MKSDRPYLVNYAIGFIIVMAMLQSFQALVYYCYSYVLDESELIAVSYAGILTVFVIFGSTIALLLLCSSKIGYILCFPLMGFRIFIATSGILSAGYENDQMLLICLSVAVIILLLTPKVRKYYLGECGNLPDFRSVLHAE